MRRAVAGTRAGTASGAEGREKTEAYDLPLPAGSYKGSSISLQDRSPCRERGGIRWGILGL